MILDEVQQALAQRLSTRPSFQEIVVNPGFTGVLIDSGDVGLAMNIRRGTALSDPRVKKLLASLIGRDALRTATELEGDPDMLVRSVRVALLNALSQPFLTEDDLHAHGFEVEVNPPNYLSGIVGKDETAVVVGFGGMVRNVAMDAKEVFVTELEPEIFRSTIVDADGVHRGPTRVKIIPSEEAAPYYRKADAVFITGSALVSNTMEELLSVSANARVVIYGWSASILPEALFQRGVDILATTRVVDGPAMMDILKNWAGTVERMFPKASESIVITRRG